MAFSPDAYDAAVYDVVTPTLHKYTTDNDYWQSLKFLVEIYDNKGRTLLLSYDSFNPESNSVKLLHCSVSLGLTNTQFTLKFEDGNGIIDQNLIGLGNRILVYAGRTADNLTLLFTGYSEQRSPIILGDNVMDYEMSGFGENASLNDIIVNFKRASTEMRDIEDPNFPKRPDSKMVVFELVTDLFEDQDVRVTRDIILRDYLNLDITGISPLVTERLLSISQSMQELSSVLNFLCEVTGAYWKIENGKLIFEYPEIKHSGIILKNKPHWSDLASSTSYFINQWRYTDSISKEDGFANRLYTTTATETKSVANAMTNQGATSLFDRAIAVQVTLMETRLNTLAFIMSKIGDPFTPLSEEDVIYRGGAPSNEEPEPLECPTGYHLDPSTNQCIPDYIPPPIVCPTGYHVDPETQYCVLDSQPPPGGDEGQLDSYGIMWLVARGEQFVVDQSRHQVEGDTIDDRWSGNITGLRNGMEATFIGKSIGVASDGHFAMKHGGGNHSTGDWENQRWYDTGLRENGDVQLQWEAHPSNHDFTLPDSKQFIDNAGKGLDGNWIGLKWVVQTVTPNGSPDNGGVRCRMWIDNDAIDPSTNKPRNNWQLAYDFIDGVDAEVIDPQDYEMPDEWDCEVRRSDTDRHDVFGLGTIILDSQEGDPGLHVRRLGTPSDPTPSCPAGYHYDQTSRQCVIDAVPACPSGYHWDVTLRRCVQDTSTTCPTGYHWDSALQRCVLDTQPPPPGGGTAFKFNIAGDFRAGNDAENTAANLVSDSPNVIFMLGDYAVGDATEEEWCNEIMAPVKNSNIPVWGCNGNHDNDDYLTVGFFENTNWVWSVKYGNIMFISCDTIAENVSATQTLVAAAQNNSAIMRIVILMHESVFKQEGGGTSGSDTTIEYHNMFKQYSKLKLVIAGHSHNWTRFTPYEGIQYIINEDGGQQPDSDTGCMHCSSDASGNITCSMVSNGGNTIDTFTIPITAGFQAAENRITYRSGPKKIIPNKVVCDPSLSPLENPKKDRKKIRQVALQQVHETVGYFDVENKITQSAPPSQLEEQVVKGEIRIDNNNTPNGPVISQFKVNVGGLSSTADTIFVNDIKVDASVLSPNGKYWIVMFPVGTSYRNTVLWHHDNDLLTQGKYSAFAKGPSKSDLSDWQVSQYGPTYTYAVFAKLRRIQEYSDPQSIERFRLKEDIAEADFLDDTVSVAKLMQNILAIRGKPVRKYDIGEVTLPLDKWFTPGQNVTIVDSTSGAQHEEGRNIFATIHEVNYDWSTDDATSTIGTFRVRILPVGSLNWHMELLPSGD